MTAYVETGTSVDAFRLRVCEALSVHGEETVASWETRGHVPREAVAGLARRGIFRDRWREGAERGLPLLTVLSEETARISSGLALAVMGHCEMFVGALRSYAATSGQLALLEDALDGTAVGCFAATEPHGGSDLAAIRTTATPTVDGWRLRGRKRYISNIGEATHVLVLARPAQTRHVGDLGLFVVPLDTPGATVDGFFQTAGVRSCDVGQVTLDVELPADALLGSPGLGLLYAAHLLHFERVSICAQLLVGAGTALRLATAFARRRGHGDKRVMDRQVIGHRLARCRAELWNLESRLRELVARARDEERMPAHEIAALKLVAGESAVAIIDASMQVMGARGVSGGFPLERIWRDCRMARLGGGTDEVLADLVASGLDRHDPDFDDLLVGYLAGDDPILDGRPGDGRR
ncbi:acyl-CoA dehydrogenase family protein [Spirillospora sp. CA-294931]|uniref:acyl-CoA dehydrogenase family protein n=1 Tax=Spirillospora sp. CA-294931 TaxID=3240042 RepID=UPI003D8F5F63